MPAKWNMATMLWDRRRRVSERPGAALVHHELATLRAALDEVRFGVVLLDHELRAQFINRAFRRMWRLPDAKADGKPAFVALMYHGRDTRAYDVPEDQLDAYVAQRVAYVKAGNAAPVDIRLANGEVVRFHCTVLPAGGRMLSYTYVTDIVSHSDEMEVLIAAFDNVEQGVILFDAQFRAQFMNSAARRLWKVSDERVAGRPLFADLVNDNRVTGALGLPPDELDDFLSRRIALVRAGDPTPMDMPMSDGRTIRSQCAVLPGGGRMLTFSDVTDLVRLAKQYERLAITDGPTGLFNRRHFLSRAESEWQRFARYHRPLTLLMLDIDHFKSINDRFGHDAGDRAITLVADACKADRRSIDIVARLGGDEFVLLLPETDAEQAAIVAERLRARIATSALSVSGSADVPLTASIGLAQATSSMSGIDALTKAADDALYRAKWAGRNRVAGGIVTALVACDIAAE
jgi:diguanylate cyclase (GGDEF)-like protein